MSVAKRLFSGTAASWMRIFITLLSQAVLVPVYLTYWDVKTFGVWMALQALVSFLSMLDQGHQTYLEFEFLKEARDKKKIAAILWSSTWVGISLGLIQVGIVAVLIVSHALGYLVGTASEANVALGKEAGYVLLIQMSVWAFLTSLGGIFVRVLSPYGYYPRMSWWGVWATVVTAVAPVVAVITGGGLLLAGVVLGIATVVYAIPQYIDIFRLIKKENIHFERPSFKTGFTNFRRSLAITAKSILENIRQQGVRVVLAPLSGSAQLVAFSTLRTGANFALQGLNTVTNPLMPELMAFLRQKDQSRTEASFSTIWLVVLIFLAPGVVFLQAFFEPLFLLWTKGKVPFHPLLFSLLSTGVLVYAVAQPAISVIRGNNLLRPQLIISVVAAVIVVGGMLVLVPLTGIAGAGFALLAAETAAAVMYTIAAKKWLSNYGLQWPVRSAQLASASVAVAAALLLCLVYFPALKMAWLSITVLVFGWIIWAFWQSIPQLVTHRTRSTLLKFPFISKLVLRG